MMKFTLLILSFMLTIACSKKEDAVVSTTPASDLTLNLTDAIKYYYAGDVVTTSATYSPQGINYSELLKGKKITKTIKIQNSPLYADYPTNIKIEELEPKIFNLDSTDCSIVKTGASCYVTISAFYSADLFTSTKTARLVLGKIDAVDLFVELSAQIRNLNITSGQYVSSYSISMDKTFTTDYVQNVIQQRTVTISNSSATKYLRNDYIIPQLVGQSPTDFYITSNECMYPVAPMSSCNIRVLFKKWKTAAIPPDTEIKLPNLTQNYSLRYGQYVTYAPVFSDWGDCSMMAVCSGVGAQSRTITSCIKNGLQSVDIANCSGTLIQSCNSPAGNRTINILGGTLNQSCDVGLTTWANQSVVCSTDFHDSGSFSCPADVFNATYSSYSPSTNPLTAVCSGQVLGTRSVVTCVRANDGSSVDVSKCVDPNPTITFKSPSGTRSIATSSGHGLQSQSCLEGSSTWTTTNVSCDNDYHQSGNDCLTNVYVATYGAYATSPVSSTVCAGTASVARSVTTCKTQHDNQDVPLSKCVDPNPTTTVSSPSGYQVVSLYDPNAPAQPAGSQNQFCSSGATTWTPINTSCYQFYTQVGNACQANNIASPYMTDASNVYKMTSSYTFNVVVDFNATDLKIYTDAACATQVGSGISPGTNLWSATATGVYARSVNSTTNKSSLCTYLFSYMYDNIAPTASLSINSGAASTTAASLSFAFNSLVENSNSVRSALIYEDSSCSTQIVEQSFTNPLNYVPSTSGVNLNLGVKLKDAAGNISSCLTGSIFYGLKVLPMYSIAPNWNDYYLAGSGTPGTACTGSEDALSSTPLCIHGGDKKIVRLDQTSCSNLSMTDDLGLFNWACQIDSLTSQAYFYSTGLVDGQGLIPLINAADPITPVFNPNRVILSQSNAPISSSSSMAWYSNTLRYLNPFLSASSVTTLTTPALYVVTSSGASAYVNSAGIFINANKIGIIAFDGVILKSTSNAANCSNLTASSGTDSNCFIAIGASSGSRMFTYLEGTFSGPTSSEDTGLIATNFPRNIALGHTGYSFFNRVSTYNAFAGLYMSYSNGNNLFKSIKSYRNSTYGLLVSNSSNYNKFYLSNIFNNQSSGLEIDYSLGNVVSNSVMNSNGNAGLRMLSSSSNIFSQVSFSNNGTNIALIQGTKNIFTMVHSSSSNFAGFDLDAASDFNKILAVNSMNNRYSGFNINSSSRNVLLNANILNNGFASSSGLYMGDSSIQNLLGQITIFKTNITGSTDAGLYSTSSIAANNKYTATLWIQDQSRNCNVGAGASLGFNASCSATGLSDFNLANTGSPLDFTGSFPVVSSSSFPYQDDVSASALTFLNAIGKNDTSFTSAMQGQCTTGLCNLFDYSLSGLDFNYRNRTNGTLVFNSAPVITTGSACPAEVSGTVFMTNGACVISSAWSSTYKTQALCENNGGTWASLEGSPTSLLPAKKFLKNAIEVVDPFSSAYISGGNHDGLCEAGESCLYTANFGAYQGHGSLSRCVYDAQGSSVSNVVMWGFSSNGK
jgi:hypothetical protein